MTNSYSTNGATTYLEVLGPKGSRLICLLDTEDLPTIQALPGAWSASWERSAKTFYVKGKAEGQFPGKRKPETQWVYLHRVVMNAPVDRDVDHLFHNGLDNRKLSLAIKTRSQNLLNRKGPQSNSSTGLLGVQYVTKKCKGKVVKGYIGEFRLNGKKYRSSIRRTPEVASGWYWAKRRSLGIPDPEQETSLKLAA